MFGRAHTTRRQQAIHTRQEEQHASEVARLRSQVARLENALAQVISASDDVVTDFQLREAELASATAPATGFAAEWTRIDTQHTAADDAFFAVAETDRRARNWLLATS